MLTKFEVSGFKSFGDWFTWDFTSRDYTFNNWHTRDHVVTKAVYLQENMIGSEHMQLALFDIYNHLGDAEEMHEQFLHNYLNSKARGKAATFRYTFRFDNRTVVYEYAKRDAKKLMTEKLWIDDVLVLEAAGNIRQVATSVYRGPELEYDHQIPSFVDQIYRELPEDDTSPLTKMVQFVEGMVWYETLSERGIRRDARAIRHLEESLYRMREVEAFESFVRSNGYDYRLTFVDEKDRHVLSIIMPDGATIPFATNAKVEIRELLLLFLWARSMFPKVSFIYFGEFDSLSFGQSAENIFKLICAQRSMQAVIVTHNTHLIRNDLTRPDTVFLQKKNQMVPLYKTVSKEIRMAQNLEKMYWDGIFDGDVD